MDRKNFSKSQINDFCRINFFGQTIFWRADEILKPTIFLATLEFLSTINFVRWENSFYREASIFFHQSQFKTYAVRRDHGRKTHSTRRFGEGTNRCNAGRISVDRRTKPTLSTYNTRMLLSRLQMIYHSQHATCNESTR